MILHALNDYYQRRQRSPDPQDRLPAFGLEEKEIPFVIEIDANGQLVNLVDTRSIVGKKKNRSAFFGAARRKKNIGRSRKPAVGHRRICTWRRYQGQA